MILSILSGGQSEMKVMFFRWLIFFSVCIYWGPSLKASDSTNMKLPRVWNLTDCIQYANSHNYDVLRLQLNGNMNEQDYFLAKAALLQDLYGTGNLNLT